tara:strand:- start:745 stop:2406 length:1662 start_codon:yes stop_codon:yes gene_type:complete
MKKRKIFEYIVTGSDPFVDQRGEINNFRLNEKVNLIATITSKKGTMRSNHYHPIQQQKCLLIKGQYVSIYKDLLNKDSKRITHVVNPGDLIITEPNVAHTMVFTKDSIFLNLVNGEREHKNYGKTHTIPYQLVDDSEREYLVDNYKHECRVCLNESFSRFVSLGFQPHPNDLLSSNKEDKYYYPLEINICKKCFNAQLSTKSNYSKIYSNYLYKSSISKEFINHFYKAAVKYVDFFKLKKKTSFIVDIGSNDGVGLLPFKKLGYKNILGFEPSEKLSRETKKLGIKTENAFFNIKNTSKLKNKVDLILASNVFAHNDDLNELFSSMKKSLKSNGSIVIEVQYFLKTIKDYSFDNIYHEHVNYWTLTSLSNFMLNHECRIFNVEEINTHGGSLRVYISKNKKIKINKSVKSILQNESKFGINNKKTYLDYQLELEKKKINVIKNMNWLKKKYNKIYGYGASAKATVSMNYFGIDKSYIKNMMDDNKLKIGKFIPGTGVKIISKKRLKESDCIIVFAWNMFSEIKKNNLDLSGTFINIRDLYKSDFIKEFSNNLS